MHGDLGLFKGIGLGVEYNRQLLGGRTGSNTHCNQATLGSL